MPITIFGYTITKTDDLRAINAANERALSVVRANLNAEKAEHQQDVAELEAELERMAQLKDILIRTNQSLMDILRKHGWLDELGQDFAEEDVRV